MSRKWFIYWWVMFVLGFGAGLVGAILAHASPDGPQWKVKAACTNHEGITWPPFLLNPGAQHDVVLVQCNDGVILNLKLEYTN